MSRTQKSFAQAAETIVEEEFEKPIETFRDVFGSSLDSIVNINEQPTKTKDYDEEIGKIQEAVKETHKNFSKNEIMFIVGTLGLTFFGTFAMAFTTLVVFSFSGKEHLLSTLLSSPIWGFILFKTISKRLDKSASLSYQIDRLFDDLIALKTNGQIIEKVRFNDNWNVKEFDWKNIKVQKNDEILEYMVRGSLDKDRNASIELKELK